MSVLIAMCQVNIALGILYLGLPESRYREKLIETILTRLADSKCDEMDVVSTDYAKLTSRDNTIFETSSLRSRLDRRSSI